MIGIELVRDRADEGARASSERNALVQAMFRRGVLVLGAGKNALRLAPPLVLFTKAQADSVLRVMDDALTDVSTSVRQRRLSHVASAFRRKVLDFRVAFRL